MSTRPCSVCHKATNRADGVCDECWRNRERIRQRIRQSDWQLELEAFIRGLEREWLMLDRIDHGQRATRPRRR